MVRQNNNKPTRHLLTYSRGWGYYKSLIPTLTKLALPSLIILSTIISTCTPILSTTIPSVNAVTNNTNQTATSTNNTTTNTSSNGSSTTNLDPSDSNYLNSVLEANGIDTSNTASNQANGSNAITTNDVDPTTMASDLASLNNALETQAANEGISLSLSSNNQPVSTTNPATINIDPSTATGSGVTANTILAATSITSNVKTAMPGYSLSISTNTDNSNLVNTDSNLSGTQNGSNILPTTGTQTSPTSLSTNTWGYAMKRDDNNQYTTKFDTTYTTGNTNSLTSKWAKVPTNQAPQTIKHTEDTPQAAGDNTTVYYAANVPKNKTAGNYQTTITYTATANVLDPPEVEKVEPGTIRQGMSMIMGDAPTATSGESGARANYTCYLTNAGSVYCAIGGTGGFDVAMFMSAVAPDGQYEVISAGNGYSWYRIKTDGIDGTITQIYTNSVQVSMYNRYPFTYTCYLTDSGGVYCALWLQYGDVPNAMSFLAPRYQYEVDNYGWYKIKTDAMDGSVVQMIMGDAPTATSGESGARANYTCYLTNAGSVYCAIGGTGGFDVAMFMSAVAPDGQYEVISAGNGYSWYRIKTDGIDGTITQIYTNSVQVSMYNRYPFTYTCYLTDSGGVYCALWLQYGDVPNAMSFLAPRYQYEVDNYGWYKIKTDAMDSSSSTAGTTITLTGKNLSKVTNVYIDANNNGILDEGTDIAVSNLKIISDTQLTFTAPSMSPGTYNLIITNPGNVVVKGTLTYR